MRDSHSLAHDRQGSVAQIHVDLKGPIDPVILARVLSRLCPEVESAALCSGLPECPLALSEAQVVWGEASVAEAVLAEGNLLLRRIAELSSDALPVSLLGLAAAAALRVKWPAARWTIGDLPLGDITAMDGLVFAVLPGRRWMGCGGQGLDLTTAVLLSVLTHSVEAGPLGEVQAEAEEGLLRVSLHRATDEIGWLGFDIDDMTGEEIGHACTHLRACPGVVELVLFPGLGKKHRPVTRFELLYRPSALDAVAKAVFLQTTTLGFRHGLQARRVLPRWPSEGAEMRSKLALRPDGHLSSKVEADDLAELPSLLARRTAAQNAR